MGPGELIHRAQISLRDSLAPPRYFTASPRDAFRILFEGDAAAALERSRLSRLLPPRLENDAESRAILAQAEALLEGRWSVFGREVRLSDPPHWSANPWTGAEWPDRPSREIDAREGSGAAGGAKFAWEVGRLTTLPTLAFAYHVSGDERFAARAERWLADWNQRNPMGRGIHHTSAIEMAVRVLDVSWTLALLGPRARGLDLDATLGLLAQQALYGHDHLSLGSSANNHILAEYMAMVVIGGLFPTMRMSEALLNRGMEGIGREVPRQIHPDGVPAEQAFGYLPFVWEILLGALRAAEAAERGPSATVRERLAASLEFARAARRSDGTLPPIGDEDDGRILLAIEGPTRLDLVGNALAAYLERPALSGNDHVLARLLAGRSPEVAQAGTDGPHEFDHGGYTVWRSGPLLITFDHGPLGLGPLAAHAHADALSLTITNGLDAVLADPGTFAYHEAPEDRDRFRGTPSHSTVSFGHRSQSERLGPFLWGRRARVEKDGDRARCRWFTGEQHIRRVAVSDPQVDLEDEVIGADPRLTFALAPGAVVRTDGTKASIAIGRTVARLESAGIEAWEVAEGEFSSRFGHRDPAPRLTARISGRRCRTTLQISAV